MDYRIVFSDVDGTLINSNYLVTPKTKDAILALSDYDCRFVPVSARMPEAIMTVTNQIGPVFPMICFNGALVLDEMQKVIASFPMPQQTAVDVCQFVEDQLPEISWNAYGNHEWLSQNHDRERIIREEEIVQVKSTSASMDDVMHMETIHKLLLMGSEDAVTAALPQLIKQFPHLAISRSSAILIEVMNEGVSKSQAVMLMCEHYGVAQKQTISFGDNYNDIDMLKTTGLSYVMGNAPDEIKAMFSHVTEDHNHDGIAIIMNYLCHK